MMSANQFSPLVYNHLARAHRDLAADAVVEPPARIVEDEAVADPKASAHAVLDLQHAETCYTLAHCDVHQLSSPPSDCCWFMVARACSMLGTVRRARGLLRKRGVALLSAAFMLAACKIGRAPL
jgi:hypothetical protein